MRENVLDWISGTMTDATSAIILTHNIDFLLLQSVLLPRLRKCGFPKLTVFADATCASGTFQQQHRLLGGVGRSCRVVPIDMGVGRRFHPKAFLLSGPTKGALAVGSGNLTHGGWSANHEIWATYDSEQDGGASLSAFRDYLATVMGLIGDDEIISAEIAEAFDASTKSWVSDLPEPAGLIGTPNERSILDRISEEVGDGILSAKVCAPYFDPDGAALSEIANRWPVRVQVFMQRRNVGLSADAAKSQPSNVDMVSVDTEPARFVHAKMLAFQGPEDVTLICGSANVSRAALLSDAAWGNAELVAFQIIGHDEAEEIFAELVPQEEPPDFPETPPSEEWDIPTVPVRLLRANHLEGLLHVKFKVDGEPERLSVMTDDGTEKAFSHWTVTGEADVIFVRCPKSISLRCKFKDGRTAESSPMWVCDEAVLGKPVPERRLTAKLIESMEGGSLSANGMLEILHLLNEHVRTPVLNRPGVTHQPPTQGETPIRPYDASEVFADGFGRSSGGGTSLVPGGFSESDFLRTFSAYFSMSGLEMDENPDQKGNPNEDGEEPPEPEDEETVAAKERHHRENRKRRIEEGVRLRKKLLTAIDLVADAMMSDDFIDGRPLERLGADIAATALLLRKALADQVLSEEDFAQATEELWRILFFGGKDTPSVLDRLATRREVDELLPPLDRLASPKFTAALTMWCAPTWGRQETYAVKFRFAAMLLATRFQWLVSAGTPDEIHAELSRLSRAMGSSIGATAFYETWLRWLESGVAFAAFEQAVQNSTPKELAQKVEQKKVRAGELLWQAGEFYVSRDNCRRGSNVTAYVMPLRGGAPKPFKGNWLAPVVALVEKDGVIEMNRDARRL